MIMLITCFLVASCGVYVCIPNRGAAGLFASMIVVGAFLALIHLVKVVILA